jgi:hypothetical protein
MMEDAEDLAGQRIFERLAQALGLFGQIFPIDKLVELLRLAARSAAACCPAQAAVSLS